VLVPKLFTVLKDYDRRQLTTDLTAGVIVGIVALPLSIAFAIASGVKPQAGLYTAIVAGFLISALGGSRVQIGGPTGAFVVVVYAIVQRYACPASPWPRSWPVSSSCSWVSSSSARSSSSSRTHS
jgi:SulP family sulfate permease